jgi:hypothetical protein
MFKFKYIHLLIFIFMILLLFILLFNNCNRNNVCDKYNIFTVGAPCTFGSCVGEFCDEVLNIFADAGDTATGDAVAGDAVAGDAVSGVVADEPLTAEQLLEEQALAEEQRVAEEWRLYHQEREAEEAVKRAECAPLCAIEEAAKAAVPLGPRIEGSPEQALAVEQRVATGAREAAGCLREHCYTPPTEQELRAMEAERAAQMARLDALEQQPEQGVGGLLESIDDDFAYGTRGGRRPADWATQAPAPDPAPPARFGPPSGRTPASGPGTGGYGARIARSRPQAMQQIQWQQAVVRTPGP